MTMPTGGAKISAARAPAESSTEYRNFTVKSRTLNIVNLSRAKKLKPICYIFALARRTYDFACLEANPAFSTVAMERFRERV